MIIDFRFSIFDFRLESADKGLPISGSRFGMSNPGVGRRVPNRKSEIQNRKSRRGITLTEILIAIMILGIGLVSLATLFPIGLLRLRDATRYTRSAYLTQTAAADAAARGLFSAQSFRRGDSLNYLLSTVLNLWYANDNGQHSPLTQDTPVLRRRLFNDPVWRRRRCRASGANSLLGRLRAAVRLRPALAVSDHQPRRPARPAITSTRAIRPPSRPGSARASASSETIRRRPPPADACPAPTACSGSPTSTGAVPIMP